MQSFHLPSGTKINSLAVEAYDNSASGDIGLTFATCQNLSQTCTYTGQGSTSGTPGYTWLTVILSSPITIDNNLNSYHVRVRLDSGDSNNAFRRRGYQLPAPGLAGSRVRHVRRRPSG